jgi:hypothetical protein
MANRVSQLACSIRHPLGRFVMLIELAAVAVHHGPDRRQRLGQPLVGDGQVHLVHLHGRERHRPQHQGRIGLDLLLHPSLCRVSTTLSSPTCSPRLTVGTLRELASASISGTLWRNLRS